ncbi:MAG: hypothetical protein JO048_09090 [Methylobacteriaceae bacterium]|nr:hypothetical protein [Methylobacteriaceae bacterium]
MRRGLGASALPDFLAGCDPALMRLPADAPSFRLEAWLVLPSATIDLAHRRSVTRFVEQAFRRAVSGPRGSPDP